MSRPLTGRIEVTSAGTFQASLPRTRGSGPRAYYTSDTRAGAQRWLDKWIPVLKAGGTIPDDAAAPAAKVAPAPSTTGTGFGEIGEKWIREKYIDLRRGQADREYQVRRHVKVIEHWMSNRGLSVETITREQAQAMFKSLEKDDTYNPIKVDVRMPADEDPDALLTLEESVALLARHKLKGSRSSLNKALRAGSLSPAGKAGQANLFRTADIFEVGARMTARADVGNVRFEHSTMLDLHRTFIAVLEHAALLRIELQHGVTKAALAKSQAVEVKKRSLTLQETARIAARLHIVHQLVLWLLRLVGLRLGEAYGLLVEDVIDLGPGQPGVLTVQSQGGKNYRHRKPDGTYTETPHVDRAKADSWRVLIVPPALMDVIRTIIDTFHTAEEGELMTKNRLVPGLKKDNAAGQSGFGEALAVAAAAEGLDIAIHGSRRSAAPGTREPVIPTPHHMRKSFTTALEADEARIEHLRQVLGHLRGEEVIHQHYLLEDPEMKPQRGIADKVQQQIDRELAGQVMVPTSIRCTTGRQPVLMRDSERIDAALMEAGWLIGTKEQDGGWITVADAAALRGVTPAQIRDDIRAGRLPAHPVDRADQAGKQYVVELSDVLVMARSLSGSRMRLLAEELDIPYDRLRQYIRRHPDLACEAIDGERDYEVSDDVADHVRTYFRAQRALEERAVRMPEVSRELGISVSAVKTLIKRGLLIEDIRFHGGIQSVTKTSLDSYRTGRRKRTNRR